MEEHLREFNRQALAILTAPGSAREFSFVMSVCTLISSAGGIVMRRCFNSS